MDRWLDADNRSLVNRAASRRLPLDDPQHAALAAESAARSYRFIRWLLIPAALQALAVVVRLTDHGAPEPVDVALIVALVLYTAVVAWVVLRYRRAYLFHSQHADFDALKDTARRRRAKA